MIQPDASARRFGGPAIVTGGAQGIGRAYCLGFGSHQVPVAVADLNGAAAQSVAEEIRSAGGEALAVEADVSDPASVAGMLRNVRDSLGPPAILVNNAAIASTMRRHPYDQIPLEEWELMLKVNVTGVYLCCSAVVPAMVERGYGKVINISSNCVWTGQPTNILHYITSKSALIGFTRALAAEISHTGVRVNAITPGPTVTAANKGLRTEAQLREFEAKTSLHQVQEDRDLVGTVMFLASTDSDFITGQTINVDGGIAFH